MLTMYLHIQLYDPPLYDASSYTTNFSGPVSQNHLSYTTIESKDIKKQGVLLPKSERQG